METNWKGASLYVIVPTENKKTAVNNQAVIQTPVAITKVIGIKKTDHVPCMNYEVHLIIATPSLILLQRHSNMIK